jgi:hypothetical protein
MPAFDERRHRQHFGRRHDSLAAAPMDAQLEHGSMVAAAGAYGIREKPPANREDHGLSRVTTSPSSAGR